MTILKLLISAVDFVMAMLMFFFLRGQVHKATKIGFGVMILLYIANVILMWN